MIACRDDDAGVYWGDGRHGEWLRKPYDEDIIECYGSEIVVSCEIVETDFIQSFDFMELHKKRIEEARAIARVEKEKKDKKDRKAQYETLKAEFEDE